MKYTLFLIFSLIVTGCGSSSGRTPKATDPAAITRPTAKVVYPKVTAVYPHDPQAYTQGLVFHEGKIYESTGQYGSSSLRRVDPESGRVEVKRELPRRYFGEGLALVGDSLLYQLTWNEQRCLVYDLKELRQKSVYSYQGEGWGLATHPAGDSLYMTNGSSRVRVMNPEGFTLYREFEVTDDRGRVGMLNELQWIGGRLWANIYLSNRIAVIDPASGAVTHYVDCASLETQITHTRQTDVFNGIAYDEQTGRIFVTGKNWDKLFQIEVEL